MTALSNLNHDVWEEVKEICLEHHEVLKKNHDPATCGTAGQHRLESTGASFLSISKFCCPSRPAEQDQVAACNDTWRSCTGPKAEWSITLHNFCQFAIN